MALNGGLTAAPLDENFVFNWVFLVELIVCGILTLFFLFYFNRLFATLLSYGLRAYTWHRYRVYIDIQALQISLLGGRVFFKGFRYHGNNETILIHSGYITWCYWLRTVREIDIGPVQEDTKKTAEGSDSEAGKLSSQQSNGQGDGAKRSANLPCRLKASLQGAEWFVYNRSPAYDAVIAGLSKEVTEATEDVSNKQHEAHNPSVTLRKRMKQMGHGHFTSSKSSSINLDEKPSTEERSSGTVQNDLSPHETFSGSQSGADRSQSGLPSENAPESIILRFLPIHIDCVKAAVVLGNENTKSILVSKADKISGVIDASRSPNPLDQYRQLFNFHFEHPVVQMKPNDDYKEDQTSAAVRIKRGTGDRSEPVEKRVHSRSFWHRHRRKAWHKLQDLVPRFRSSVESAISGGHEHTESGAHGVTGQMNWQGLSRYLDDNEQDDRARWSTIEYATVTTIADSPQADMSFYWDVTGVVQENSTDPKRHGRFSANINGDEPPGWGINLSLKGALINYGPWADRQRADLQRVFFPSLCKDATPAKGLVPGQNRAPTEFKVYIELDEETTLRVPIREESKNWKWTKHVDTMDLQKEHKKSTNKSRKAKAEKGNQGAEVRPFGWLDVMVGPNATISYAMDMMASDAGYSNTLTMDLPQIEITTSVNHGLLWKSTDNQLACDLSNPLQWNGHHTWKFDILSSGLELFILREHVFLLIDFVDDWASGPPPEYLTYSPFRYLVDLHLKDFRIYLNVNDSNIINNPSDFDDNTFISIFGSILDAEVCIPLDSYRPHRNDITFNVDASRGGLNLHVPPWNTQATFLSSTEIATLDELIIDGTYQYCATTSPSNTDILLLNVHGNNLSAQVYGFIIRYYLKIKDNYFGDDIRFKTLEEYQEVLHSTLDGGEHIVSQAPHKKSNDLDVILSVSAKDSSAILPAGLYTATNHTRIDISSLAVDLRFTNYYMELEVTFNTLAFSQGNASDGTATPMSALSNTQLFIDGITVSGNRLFGLPPAEPTYICNWDFAVGAVTGECTTDFFSRLAKGGRAVGFSFDDDENALPSIVEAILHDVTYLRANIESVRVWLHADEAAFLLSTGLISVNFNDLAGSHYSKKLSLSLPDLQIACVDAESASRHRSRPQHSVETHALVETSISFMMIQRKLKFKQDRQLQQEHIKRHDQRTHRTDFLLNDKLLDDSMLVAVDPPAMTIPPMPIPLSSDVPEIEGRSMSSKMSSASGLKRMTGRKGSFLSISSRSQRSTTDVIRPQIQASGDSRSRNLQVQVGQLPLRDVSVSSGQRSSLYSGVGESRGLPPSSVTFSSSFMAPYFPLEGVAPDARHLPPVPELLEEGTGDKDSLRGGDEITCDSINEDTEHISLMLQLPCGIRGVFNPQAVEAVATLLTALQPVDPSDILDELQIESMNEIFALNRQKTVKGQVTDFNVSTPCIVMRFLNSSVSASRNSPRVTVDQYDLSISDVKLTTRSKVAPKSSGVSEEQRKSSVTHLSVRAISLAAKERYNDMEDPQAAINALVEDLVFWAASDKETNASIGFNSLEMATVSNKIEYHASLLHRTGVTASNLAEMFSSRLRQQQNRVQLCTYLVATYGQQTPDPLFLTRPSYVLRSAADHLRNSDSWKVVTRLHHMYTSLESSTRQDIGLRCLNNAELVPDNARLQVLGSFTQWRSWDLNNVHECLVMARVYGSNAERGPKSPSHSKPASLVFNTENIRLVLDPGPKQNEISLTSIAATIATRHIVREKSITAGLKSQLTQSTTIQVFCMDVSINLNWELCELFDNILNLYQQTEPQPASPEPRSPSTFDADDLMPKPEWHVIVATEKGSITVETINLSATFMSEGLNSSFLVTNVVDGDNHQAMNLVLAADSVLSKFKSRSAVLTLYQLRFPSICASHETTQTRTLPMSAYTLAANCQELSFVIHRDVSALLEVLDLVIVDEVAQLHQLTKKLPEKSLNQSDSVPSTPTPVATSKVNVALFLDKYHISVPLLHSLTYNISGVVARASVAAQLGSDIIFDFDVKENSHNIKTLGTSKVQSISLLQIPPTNGRITTHMSKQELIVSVFASIEPVEIDAAAIHSLLTAVNRPEIASVLSDVKEELKLVQRHIDDIFGQEKTQPVQSKSPGRQLIYDAHITLAGFNVFANSQGAKKGQNSARLDLNLGCVQFVVANRLEQNSPVLEYPELRVSMREIIFELSRKHNDRMEPCGNLSFGAFLTATSKPNHLGTEVRSFHLKSDGSEVNLFADTALTVVDIIGHLQEKIKELDFSREKQYLRRFSKSIPQLTVNEESKDSDAISNSTVIFASMYSLELLDIQVCWLVETHDNEQASTEDMENLVLSFKRIDLSTRKENSARLTIEDLQLQMVPPSQSKTQRSLNSALLPEVIFNVGYVSSPDARRLAFQAAGKSMDLRLTSQFIIPASNLQKSIGAAAEKVREASELWLAPTAGQPTDSSTTRKSFFGKKRMESLLVDADFAGAVVHLSGKRVYDQPNLAASKNGRVPQPGRYGQFNTPNDTSSNTVLRSPGLAWKVEYKDSGLDEPSLNAEVKVNASSNILYPAVVPLVMEMTATVKEIISDNNEGDNSEVKASPQSFLNVEEDNILAADPSAILGRTRLNFGLRICRQEFSLSCQPIARVAATARFEDIYLTINTVRSTEHGHFFTASAAFSKLQASVQHVYSRESTGSFDVDSVILSLMNSKHVSGTSGLSAILKISPMKALINAKQLQDFLLFREIWIPPEIRQSTSAASPAPSTSQSQTILVQRYQQVASTGAFPWNATISIEELDVQLDLGQAIGKSAFMISNFWLSSKKNSDWEQNLCLGFDKVGVDSTGRMSGFVQLQHFKLRTSIQWPAREKALNQTPLVQASLAFSQFRVKAAFDYQAFLVADITSFEFFMYNVRNRSSSKGDRLVAMLDGEAVQVFCTATSASQGLALYQAFQRLVQEKRSNYEASLSEIERFMKRKSSVSHAHAFPQRKTPADQIEDKATKSPISLHTDVIVTLKAVNIGAFPSTFSDHQVFKLEALNAQAKFAVTMESGKVHSSLGLTLGQLRIGLAGVKRVGLPKSVGEISVEDVVSNATGSRGGTILKVPRVEATMQTWQVPDSNHIEYIFKSSFEGKVEVGWNYSRIGYIRSMWATHSKALAQRLGKPLPPSAVKITGVPEKEDGDGGRIDGEQQKITAEVNVPQSKYDYTALEAPVIETPQLRDMGEATPPLEWIGLHRDRLPNLTHQIVIVTLLEIASEVEDAYGKILGSS